MPLIEYQIPYIFSSSPTNGAQAISKDKNEFTVTLNEPVRIPRGALNCTIELQNASITYVSPNISAERLNTLLDFDYLGTPYNIVFPDGLYSLGDINSFLSRFFVAAGLPTDLFAFTGESATQKTVLTFNYAGTRIDFTTPDSINPLLGFESIFYPLLLPSTVGESFTSENEAQLNSLIAYLIDCSLCSGNGIPINQNSSNIIASVPITVAPGSLLVYSPFNSVKTNCDTLIGSPTNNVRVRITDQEGRDIDMLDDPWSITVIIKYYLQVGDSRPARSHYKNSQHHEAF